MTVRLRRMARLSAAMAVADLVVRHSDFEWPCWKWNVGAGFAKPARFLFWAAFAEAAPTAYKVKQLYPL